MVFYTNKYPIKGIFQHGMDDLATIPAGTPFEIESMDECFINLKPLERIDGVESIAIAPDMLALCYQEVEGRKSSD